MSNYAHNSQMYFYGNECQKRLVHLLCKQFDLKCEIKPSKTPKPSLTDLDVKFFNMIDIIKHLSQKSSFQQVFTEEELNLLKKLDGLTFLLESASKIEQNLHEFEAQIKHNKGYFFFDHLTICDLYFADILQLFIESFCTKQKVQTDFPCGLTLWESVNSTIPATDDCWGRVLFKIERRRK